MGKVRGKAVSQLQDRLEEVRGSITRGNENLLHAKRESEYWRGFVDAKKNEEATLESLLKGGK